MRADPVGHRPRVAVEDAALGARAEQPCPAPPPERSAALHLREADADLMSEVAGLDPELLSLPRGVRERRVPVLLVEDRAAEQVGDRRHHVDVAHEALVDPALGLSRRLHEERHRRDLLHVALAQQAAAPHAHLEGVAVVGRHDRRARGAAARFAGAVPAARRSGGRCSPPAAGGAGGCAPTGPGRRSPAAC